MKRVVITGIGPMSSLGTGCKETWDSILSSRLNLVKEHYSVGGEEWGEFYLHKLRDFSIDKFDLPKENFKFVKGLRTVKKEDTDLYYLLAVIKLAIEDSKLKYDLENNAMGLILSHENPGVEIFFEELIDSLYDIFKTNQGKDATKLELAKAVYNGGCEERGYNLQSFSYLFSAAKVFDLHGYSLFINNACASGLFAIESAARQIKSGVSPAVIVAAVDNPTKIYKYLWFKKKGLYAEDGITRPFSDEANGIVFGDGGAALVLEDLEHAKARSAHIYAEYLGGGFSLEGWKITVPDVTGDFYARSFRQALETARIKPDDVDFVNPHGVGMKITDIYEARTINDVFKGKKPLVSAFKPLVGHNLGGSALLESAIALLAMENSLVPATLNYKSGANGLKIVSKNQKADINVMAKMSCGFAGFNGVSIFGKVT
ncbi:MAG: beta-ketoacyl synthase N-terminal-like domain-containing protein [Candidatus Omnitrophica bacterium]|nr:beta-ketoacyl synthase N-terminal-like domain-containing protein [Candidatus Omnitrophota bacterium]